MFYTVYKMTNKIDAREYIGVHQTSNIEDDYYGSGTVLNRAIAKHGLDNFEKTILFIFDNAEEMFAKEKELVNEEYVNRRDTYNARIGGAGGWDYVNKAGLNNLTQKSPESIEKGRLKKVGQKFPTVSAALVEQHRNGSRPKVDPMAFKGKKHTEETRAKIRAAPKSYGPKNGSFGTIWVNNGEIDKKIKAELFPEFEAQGFCRGKKKRALV